MAKNPKWLINQIKRSNPELEIDVDSSDDIGRMSAMTARAHKEAEEIRNNPNTALARITEQKVYFTAEELYLAYGKQMKPSASRVAEQIAPESLTQYEDIATNTDEEFWDDVARIEGHWTQKR